MRKAYKFATQELKATHIIADVFTDKFHGYLEEFYFKLGFNVLFGPYRDERFLNAPESLLLILDVSQALDRAKISDGEMKKLYEFFLR